MVNEYGNISISTLYFSIIKSVILILFLSKLFIVYVPLLNIISYVIESNVKEYLLLETSNSKFFL